MYPIALDSGAIQKHLDASVDHVRLGTIAPADGIPAWPAERGSARPPSPLSLAVNGSSSDLTCSPCRAGIAPVQCRWYQG